MKAKDRKEYISMLDASLQSWVPYANTVGLDAAQKTIADAVVSALRARIEYVSTIKSTSARSSAKKVEQESAPSASSANTDYGAESSAAQNCTSMSLKIAISMLTDVAHFMDESTGNMDDNLMAAAMDVQSARIRLLRAYNHK